MVIIKIACCKGSNTFIIKRVRRSSSGFDDVAFVKFELYFTCYILLGRFNESLNMPNRQLTTVCGDLGDSQSPTL